MDNKEDIRIEFYKVFSFLLFGLWSGGVILLLTIFGFDFFCFVLMDGVFTDFDRHTELVPRIAPVGGGGGWYVTVLQH